MSRRIPWTERSRRGRAIADILLGCYPRFVFGGGLPSSILPVFHFHSVTPAYLRPFLEHLARHDYRTPGVDEFLEIVAGRDSVPGRCVLLCFDDAWSSVWTVAAPLLRACDFRAVTFAIPGRVSTAGGLRPEAGPDTPAEAVDAGPEPFARWDELRALDQEGVVEVEAHTFAHARVPVGSEPVGRWTAEAIAATPLLSRPVVEEGGRIRPIGEGEAGAPRRVMRPRMAEARAWLEEEGRAETPGEAAAAVRADLERCRRSLEAELGRPSRLLCFPWAVAGRTARLEARAAGFEAAFSDRFPGRRYVRPGDDPFRLMRLKHEWLPRLPGSAERV
ncbi:MAG: polysaccharide deacetylase family protein [Puniceicoccaceae bacterium]